MQAAGISLPLDRRSRGLHASPVKSPISAVTRTPMSRRTRFAPSPTGYLHIGGARTALYCWLEARRHSGQFILRVEDTDRDRSTQAAIDAILEAMDWLGLGYDEGPIYQTQRLDRHREVAEQMVAAGTAYYSYETKEELDAMREEAM